MWLPLLLPPPPPVSVLIQRLKVCQLLKNLLKNLFIESFTEEASTKYDCVANAMDAITPYYRKLFLRDAEYKELETAAKHAVVDACADTLSRAKAKHRALAALPVVIKKSKEIAAGNSQGHNKKFRFRWEGRR